MKALSPSQCKIQLKVFLTPSIVPGSSSHNYLGSRHLNRLECYRDVYSSCSLLFRGSDSHPTFPSLKLVVPENMATMIHEAAIRIQFRYM